ncbi:MAG: methionyl-tRNA formyltransferase [Ktedonobacterales bacterium]
MGEEQADQQPIRIVFMGTPAFAVPSLWTLGEHTAPGDLWPGGLALVGVVTRPDKPIGRGQQTVYTPAKQYALDAGLPIYQPGPLRRPEAFDLLRSLAPDLIVVAAFGQILPLDVLRLPAHGCLNIHASLLPRWRGASPIAAAIQAGEEETGVTIMLMNEGLDTGDILTARATPIGQQETTGALTERLAILGAHLLRETLPQWLAGRITPQPQNEAQATMTRPQRKEDGRLDWSHPADVLDRQIRAVTPWPSAFTTWNGKQLKVLRARPLPSGLLPETLRETTPTPGATFPLGANAGYGALGCACGQGALALEVVQLEGKRALPSEELLRGYPNLAHATLGA